ncbi:dioxygenase [Streptomyces californicus]
MTRATARPKKNRSSSVRCGFASSAGRASQVTPSRRASRQRERVRFGRSCRPFPGALLDFWQADTNGSYDMAQFNLRATANGGRRLVQPHHDRAGPLPGPYAPRVKAQAPGGRILTTQLYFPNEPRNNTDALFDPELLMNVRNVGNGRQGSFDFVLTSPDARAVRTAHQAAHRAGDQLGLRHLLPRGRPRDLRRGRLPLLQAHQAISGWEPPNVPALWERG